MVLEIGLIILGFILLIFGANWMVGGASALAKKYNISDLAIGLTIVAFGTSAPELVVNGLASFDGLSDIVYGNVIGSCNFNVFVILGIVGIILPITVQSNTVRKEMPISLITVVLVLLLSQNFYLGGSKILSRIDALVLMVLFLGFLWYVYTQMKSEVKSSDSDHEHMSGRKMIILIALGLVAMVIGGKLVVDNAINIASTLGVSNKIIGLTIVAAGTSLPELVTSIVAALKKNSDIAIGNVIGSNIFNLLFVLPISAMISPVDYNSLFNIDLYMLIGGTVLLLLAMFSGGRLKLDRWEAAVLLLTFMAYTVYQISLEL